MSDDGAIVIHLPGLQKPEADFPITRKTEPYDCRHDRTVLVDETRRVECKDCGREVEAYAVMLRWAGEWHSLSTRYGAIRKDIEAASTRLESLLRRERNAKSRLRNAANSADGVERVVALARRLLAPVDHQTEFVIRRDLRAALDALDALDTTHADGPAAVHAPGPATPD